MDVSRTLIDIWKESNTKHIGIITVMDLRRAFVISKRKVKNPYFQQNDVYE